MNDLILEALRIRITRVFPAQIHAAIAPLTDEQLWWRPNEYSNSIANIVIHLTGSINHFLNRNLGALDYTRDRPGEFANRSEASKAEVQAAFHAPSLYDEVLNCRSAYPACFANSRFT